MFVRRNNCILCIMQLRYLAGPIICHKLTTLSKVSCSQIKTNINQNIPYLGKKVLSYQTHFSTCNHNQVLMAYSISSKTAQVNRAESTPNLEITHTRLNAVTVAGTRPELVKLAEFIRIFNDSDNALLYTGQHFSSNMRDVFLGQLGIKPDLDLNAGTSSVEMLKKLLISKLEPLRPKFIIVYGDTNSSMAAALAAKDLGSRLIHLEAGVRDFDLAVPEESTRIKIDAMADLLLAPSDFCQMCLRYENVGG